MSKQQILDDKLKEMRAKFDDLTREYIADVNRISQYAINSGHNGHSGLPNTLITEMLGAVTSAYNSAYNNIRALRVASSNVSNGKYTIGPTIINDHFVGSGKRKRKTRKHRR